MNWILIALISITGFVKGVNVEVIGEFQSEVACLSAARDVKKSLENDIDKDIKTLCLPTLLDITPKYEIQLLKELKAPRKKTNFNPSR